MKILTLRTVYKQLTTRGVMLLNGEFFGYTLEDYVRHDKKVYGETAIPAGIYRVVVDYSPRFKRDMPRLIDVPHFQGIRIHGGNTHKNTLGCPLVAKNKSDEALLASKIWGSLESELTRRLKSSSDKTHWIEIINTLEV